MNKKQHIVVSGGGLSGLTSAISLAMACPFFHITLIERSKFDMNLQTNQDARTSALSYVSAVFFHKLGIFANIKHNLGIIEDIRVIEGNNNPFYVHFNKQDANFFDCTLQMEDKADREDKAGKNEGKSGVNSNNGNSDDDFCDTPPMGYIAQNNLLKQALLEKAYSIKNIHIIDNVAYEEIWQNAGGLIFIKLNNGNILEANLLLNTEGKFSKLRQMAGLTTMLTILLWFSLNLHAVPKFIKICLRKSFCSILQQSLVAIWVRFPSLQSVVLTRCNYLMLKTINLRFCLVVLHWGMHAILFTQ
jgi:2-polyprenyl-6-methoxyphenol hydroxylase-like FAD-dependent oxidoreductase